MVVLVRYGGMRRGNVSEGVEVLVEGRGEAYSCQCISPERDGTGCLFLVRVRSMS